MSRRKDAESWDRDEVFEDWVTNGSDISPDR